MNTGSEREDARSRARLLPLLLSVPHTGLAVPGEVAEYCILTPEQIEADGDGGAAEIYDLAHRVAHFHTTTVARAIVDLNRAEDDRRTDGVVKTHTCWNEPVYRSFPPESAVETLLALHHRPYHARLRVSAATGGAFLGIDCHTMAAEGPPVGPDPGRARPAVCLSDGDGTCPREWVEGLAECFREALEEAVQHSPTDDSSARGSALSALRVAVNDPFRGGHIIRSHSSELPWVQLELSRAAFMTNREKRGLVQAALERFCDRAPA